MFTTERTFVRKNKKEENGHSSDNISFSSNNSFYEKLGEEIKRDIIFLIESGYNKKTIIKLYLFAKPVNLNEAVSYLSKENGINQHYFYSSPYEKDTCEICGDQRSLHIKNINNSKDISFIRVNSNAIQNEVNINILKIKTKEERKTRCKICEEEITLEEELKNKCQQCNTFFCNECLYLHIKELIKTGKYSLFCPECKLVYTKDKIEEIILFNIKDENEVNNLKALLKKSNAKEFIISNPELMFCPIPNCDGFARKKNNQEYNICTHGHKFCTKCGKFWHKNGKCKEAEKVEELFEKYSRKYDLKNCPYCNIVTIKNGGCNHMTCHYCGKHWCWLCRKIFISIDEHYGNRNSKCYQKMNANVDVIICSKCEIEIIDNNNNFKTFNCDHRICRNCFIEYLLERDTMILFPDKIIECPILRCKGLIRERGINIIKYIEESNNEKLIKKYKFSILLFQYLIVPFFPRELERYIDFFGYFVEFVMDLFKCTQKYETLYSILEIVGIFFGIIYIIIIFATPLFFIFAIKDLYYIKFLPEIRKQFNNILVFLIIVLGEEILGLVFLFGLMACHFIYFALFFPILFLVLIVRKCIYGINICY